MYAFKLVCRRHTSLVIISTGHNSDVFIKQRHKGVGHLTNKNSHIIIIEFFVSVGKFMFISLYKLVSQDMKNVDRDIFVSDNEVSIYG